MIDKAERRKRIIEDFKKIFPGDDVAVKFAENISDETLDEFEKRCFSSERKVRIDNLDTNLEIKCESSCPNSEQHFCYKGDSKSDKSSSECKQ